MATNKPLGFKVLEEYLCYQKLFEVSSDRLLIGANFNLKIF